MWRETKNSSFPKYIMCGRTALSLNKDRVCCACSYKSKSTDFYQKPEWLDEHNDGKEYKPSYNIVPTEVTPVLVSAKRFNQDASTRILKPMMWGIIPPWHTGNYKTHNLSTNNCRLENISTSKLYSPILRNGGRCVIVVEGFYEWKTTDKSAKVKQPYFIYMTQDNDQKIDDPFTWNQDFSEAEGWKGVKLLHMAGLYNVWQNGNTIIYAYSVITMESNSSLSWLHHRMPAILETEEQINTWLDVENVDADMAVSYLRPVFIQSWHPVSTLVNNSRNKSIDCIKRQVEQKKPGKQKALTAWFTKAEKRKSPEDSKTEGSTSICKKTKMT